MGSLTAHLLEPGDHGRLPFHPSCPVCRRERLSGTLSTEPVIPRRAQAVLAGGILAVSAGAPGLAVAAVPERQAEGVAAPEDPPGAELDDPDFDPGGETSLPFETGHAPSETGTDDGDGAPIDAEPIDDPDGRLAPLVPDDVVPTGDDASPLAEQVPPGTGNGANDVAEQVPPAAGNGANGVTGTPSPPDTLPPDTLPPATGDVTAPDSPLSAPPRETERRDSAKRAEEDRGFREDRPGAGGRALGEETAVAQAPTPLPPAPAVDTTLTVPATQPASTAQAPATTGRHRDSSLRDARVYVVQRGDSLWSIAKRLLGADASPARISREVDRLWSLNQERIATGDPDLLHVGTELRLRGEPTR